MDPRRIRAALALGAAVLFAACGSDDPGPEVPGLPEADGAALWSYLEEQAYDGNWSLWPGTTEQYESTSDKHGVTLTTYVNELALSAIQGGASAMPAGAIVVKENYMDGDLMAITTMYKVDGFNPEDGDWFWLQNDPAGMIMAEGAVDMCIECHRGAADQDYLFLNK